MTSTNSAFFVPKAEDNEAILGELAKFAGRAVPEPGRRIQSITFDNNGSGPRQSASRCEVCDATWVSGGGSGRRSPSAFRTMR
jgi:hypothetical protein